MNKRELRLAVRQRNAIPDNGSGLVEHDVIDDCIAAALLDISAEQRWPWLRTSASLTFTGNTAPLPAGCMQTEVLTIGGYPVPRVGLNEFLEQTAFYVWTDNGANVLVHPTPTVTLSSPTLYYYRDEPTLADDTESPLLPTAWHRAVVAGASYHLNVRRDDKARVTLDSNEYRDLVGKMRQSSVRDTGPKKIRSSFRVEQRATWS